MLDDFNAFWAACPRKVGKGQARKAYAKAVKIAPHDEIMLGLSQQRASMEAKEPQFIPHASTWLNGERWTDDPEPSYTKHSSADTAGRQIAFAARAARAPSSDCFCRGHWRRSNSKQAKIVDGEPRVWIDGHWKGDPDKGIVLHDYVARVEDMEARSALII